jgi:hypothetical protein
MVPLDGSHLLLAGAPLSGFAQTSSQLWGDRGVRAVYARAPDYSYGGVVITIYIVVYSDESNGKFYYQNDVKNSVQNGYSTVGTTTDIGDEATLLQKIVSDQATYNVIWRDRNVTGDFYLSSGVPPAPDVSMGTLLTLALQQEQPIAANLQDW